MAMFKRLFDVGTTLGIIDPNITKVLTLYNDNPFITAETNLRTSVAITIPKDVAIVVPDDVTETTLEGRFGVGHFDLKRRDYGKAWHAMYHDWLFKSDLKGRDAVPFECYVTQPPHSVKETSKVDIYIPIEA